MKKAAAVAVLCLTSSVARAEANAEKCGEWMEDFHVAPYNNWGSTPPDIQRKWDESDCNHKVCRYMKRRYGVVPHESWGTLPPHLQKVWDTPQVDCNNHVREDRMEEPPPPPAPMPAAGIANHQQCGVWMEQFQLAPYRSWGSTPGDIQKVWDASDCNHKVCRYMQERYGVIPHNSWGTLPPNLQQVWDTPQVDCNSRVEQRAPPPPPVPSVVDNRQCGVWMEQFQLAPYRSWGSTPGDIQKVWDASDCNHQVCQYMKERYGVTPYKSWGSLPGNLQRVWDTPEVDCNHHVH